MGTTTWGRRGAAAFVAAVSIGLLTGGPSWAAGADQDCEDFRYQEDAQAWMDAHPGDPDRLDGDRRNGVACESLPHRPGAPVPAPAPVLVPAPAPGATCLSGSIADRYQGTGGAGGSLGAVVQCQTPTPVRSGEYAHFANGSIYSSPRTGAQFTRGAIRDRWAATGWENGRLGFPVTSDAPTSGGRGWYARFEGGSIYFSPATGAHFTAGAIRQAYVQQGHEAGGLGFPRTDDTPTPGGGGYYTHFEGGSVYWSPQTGAHDVRGAIRDEWASLGWENGYLGFPATGDTRTPDGSGYYGRFQGGSVYWSPASGAHAVRGPVLEAWASVGWENGVLGYPVEDERDGGAGATVQRFQGGLISCTPGFPPTIVAGAHAPA
jgi:uncharacterized protein with LGFP repeats